MLLKFQRMQAMSEELKAKGNAAFAAKNYNEAIDFFSQAIALESPCSARAYKGARPRVPSARVIGQFHVPARV